MVVDVESDRRLVDVTVAAMDIVVVAAAGNGRGRLSFL